MGNPIPICQEIGSRDGTLNADSYMSNFYAENGGDGGWWAVLRPGCTLALSPSTYGTTAAPAQGLCSYGNYVFSITQLGGVDTLCCVNYTLPTTALTGGTTQGADYVTLNSIYTTNGNWFTVLQSQFGMWVMPSNSSAVHVTNSAYPLNAGQQTVRGVGYLDGSWYVMTYYGAIYGSAIDDPTTWSALNLIYTDRGIGAGVSILRHLQYIVAFCDDGLQFFYDAGNPPPGSALSALPSGTFMIGCVSARSIAQTEQMTVFMGKTAQKGRSVYALQGLTVTNMSNVFVDRILNQANLVTVNSMAVKIGGHNHYVLSLPDLSLSLDCDLSTGKWSIWQNSSGTGCFNGAYYLNPILTVALAPIGDFIQGNTDGCVYLMQPNLATDNGNPITGTIQTTTYGDGYHRTYCGTLTMVGDTVSASVNVSYSDNDYGTYSNPVALSMSYLRKQLTRLGSFYRRSFLFTYAGGVPIRLKEFYIGKTPRGQQ